MRSPNLAGQSRRNKFSIELIQQKNLLLAQINSPSLPEQKAALTQLVINVRSKVSSFHMAEKLASTIGLLKGPKMNSM